MSGGDCAAPEARLRELIGGRWQSVGDFFLDIVIAMGVWLGALMVIALAAVAMGMNHAGNLSDAQKQIGFLAPQNRLEVFLWICLSATAGFCEEVLFRGYFQKQFTRLLRSRWIALVVVSILFGLGHGYEGAQRMVLIALLGFAFGLMSLLRKSLRPAMMAHTLQDTISGLLALQPDGLTRCTIRVPRVFRAREEPCTFELRYFESVGGSQQRPLRAAGSQANQFRDASVHDSLTFSFFT